MSQAPREPREKDYDTVVQDDLRPAGNGKDCFYCGKPLGNKHKNDCVIRKCAGSYLVAIRENATGETRMYRYDMAWDELDLWMWTEGNLSCDCNRHLDFLRAGGCGPPDDPHWNNIERECGNSAYSVLYAELPDGKRITIDEQP